MLLFFKSLIAGFAVSLPLGPIGILCMRRMFTDGPLVGLASGLGAATADAFYATIAALGISFISAFIIAHQAAFTLFGGLFLISIGAAILLSKPRKKARVQHTDIIHGYLSTLLITVTSPATLFTFLGVFALLGINALQNGEFHGIGLVASGVFTGAALWWSSFALTIALLQLRLDFAMIRRINTISGAAIILCGVLVLLSLLITKHCPLLDFSHVVGGPSTE